MAWDRARALEMIVGAEGLQMRRNTNLVTVGSLRSARSVTLEDDSMRTAGGATMLGTSAGATLVGRAAIDYFPTRLVQRTVVSFDDGTIRKDNGSGESWATVKSGLTTATARPMFTLGGLELVNRSRKLFHCDRVNAVQVLADDGSATTDLSLPPADWAGTNQPGFLAPHERWMFGGGNLNDPKRLYRSSGEDHEDYQNTSFTLSIAGEYERLVAAISYKGGLLVWGYPEGVWFVNYDSPDAAATSWKITKVGRPGAAGPYNVLAVEDDVLWISPDGSVHLISATNATGSATASDIGYRKLSSYIPDTLNLANLDEAQWIYYAQKQKAWLACYQAGATLKQFRLEFDVRRRGDVGERWTNSDRDVNAALFLRKISQVLTPAMVDNVGQVWELDRPTRTVNGLAFAAEWQTNDLDVAGLIFGRPGHKTNGRYIQIEYDPRQNVNLTIDVFRDGERTQTLLFTLNAGSATLPQVLPFTLQSSRVLRTTRRQRLFGQAVRWGVRATTSGINADASVTRITLGMELAAT